MLKEFTSSHELHCKEDFLGGLERIGHVGEKRMDCFCKNQSLCLDVLDLLLVYYFILSERFESEVFLSVLLLNQHDLPKGTPTQNFQQLKIINANFLPLLL